MLRMAERNANIRILVAEVRVRELRAGERLTESRESEREDFRDRKHAEGTKVYRSSLKSIGYSVRRGR